MYLINLSPFIAYLLTNTFFHEPHDCFECYNRLPGVRYSSFQYSAYERNRNLEARYGNGAVKIYENLVIEAQKEVDREIREKQKKNKPGFVETVIVDEHGNTNESLVRDFRAEQARLAQMVMILDQQRLETYRREQAALPFNQRELPFTDDDVLRLGGPILTTCNDSEDSDEIEEINRLHPSESIQRR